MSLLFSFAMLATILLALCVLVFYIALGISFAWSHHKGAPYVRSKKNKTETMLELAQIKPGETVVDLGSGDGILVKEAANLGAKAIGLEINPFLAWYSQGGLLKKHSGKNYHIFRCNFHDFPLNNADVIFLYLFPSTIEKLMSKFVRELKPGARVVSNSFPIRNWKPVAEKNKVFLYKIRPHSSIGRAVAS